MILSKQCIDIVFVFGREMWCFWIDDQCDKCTGKGGPVEHMFRDYMIITVYGKKHNIQDTNKDTRRKHKSNEIRI